MSIFDLFRYFLVLMVPGLIGALAFSITARFKTEINPIVALILDLITFTTMIIGLYYFKHIQTMSDLMFEFTCLSFTRKYILVSILVTTGWGVLFGFIRRLFFWIRR